MPRSLPAASRKSLTYGVGRWKSLVALKATSDADLKAALAFPMNSQGVSFAACSTPYARCKTLPLDSQLGQPLLACQNQTCPYDSAQQDAIMSCASQHCQPYFSQIYGDECIPLTDPVLLQHNIVLDTGASLLDRSWNDQLDNYWAIVNNPALRQAVLNGAMQSNATLGACMLAPPLTSPCTGDDNVTTIQGSSDGTTTHRKVAGCVQNQIQPLAQPGAACTRNEDCIFGNCDGATRQCAVFSDAMLTTQSIARSMPKLGLPTAAILGIIVTALGSILLLSFLLVHHRSKRAAAPKKIRLKPAMVQVPATAGSPTSESDHSERVTSVYIPMESRVNRRSSDFMLNSRPLSKVSMAHTSSPSLAVSPSEPELDHSMTLDTDHSMLDGDHSMRDAPPGNNRHSLLSVTHHHLPEMDLSTAPMTSDSSSSIHGAAHR
ncbi:hypothetical protein RI367_006955 [Sorochytrium milnesiophthora]